MKKHYFYPLLLCTAVCITACNKEDAGTPGDTTGDKLISLIGQEAQPYQQRMEVPKVTDQSMFIVHSTEKYGVTYTEEWDKENRTQRWAAYRISDINAVSNWNRNNWKGTIWKGAYWNGDPFQEDSIIPHLYRTYASDHYNNGFDRGHIVNSADRLMSQNANGQTYYLSNIQCRHLGEHGELGAQPGIQQAETQNAIYRQGRNNHPNCKHTQPFPDRSRDKKNKP